MKKHVSKVRKPKVLDKLEDVYLLNEGHIIYRAIRCALFPAAALISLQCLNYIEIGIASNGAVLQASNPKWIIGSLYVTILAILVLTKFGKTSWSKITRISSRMAFNLLLAGVIITYVCSMFSSSMRSLFQFTSEGVSEINSSIEWLGVPYGILVALVLVNVWLQRERTEKDIDDEADDAHDLVECTNTAYRSLLEPKPGESEQIGSQSRKDLFSLFLKIAKGISNLARHSISMHSYEEHRIQKGMEDSRSGTKFFEFKPIQLSINFEEIRNPKLAMQRRRYKLFHPPKYISLGFRYKNSEMDPRLEERFKLRFDNVSELRLEPSEGSSAIISVHRRLNGLPVVQLVEVNIDQEGNWFAKKRTCKEMGDTYLKEIRNAIDSMLIGREEKSLLTRLLEHYTSLADHRGDRIGNAQVRVPSVMRALIIIASIIWLSPFWILAGTAQIPLDGRVYPGPSWTYSIIIATLSTFIVRGILDLITALDDPFAEGPFRVKADSWMDVKVEADELHSRMLKESAKCVDANHDS